jgi:alpha-L-fucosidase
MIRGAMSAASPVRLVPALLIFVAALVSAAPQQWPEAHPPVGQQPRRPAGYNPFNYPRTPDDLWRSETGALLEHSAQARAGIERTIARGPYRATFKSISTHKAPEWFLDAKFGMFVDWGPWSVAGWAPQAEKATYPDWYEQKLFKEYREYHEKTWGTDIGPDDLIQLLDGGQFDPASLASLAKAAGMQYVVPFLKHHGGYCLWDSSFTHRDAMEWGLKRDLASELASAFRKEGLRSGAYVSLSEWAYPVVRDNTLWQMTFNGEATMPLDPKAPFLSGKIAVPDFARDYLVPSITELIDRTTPDIVWFDGEWEADAAQWRGPEIAAYYYNRAAAHGQDVAVNDRFGKDTRGKPGWGDYYTSEFHVIEGFQAHPWEENRSLSHSYGYNWEESFDDRYVLPEPDALDMLLRVVANGGNLLLMVSPDGSGRVPPNQERRLRFIGAWLRKYGEAVYATRPIGVSQQPSWGYLTRSKSGDRIYCIIRHWPTDGRLVIPVSVKATQATLLGGTAQLPLTARTNAVTVDLSRQTAPDRDASVVVLRVR